MIKSFIKNFYKLITNVKIKDLVNLYKFVEVKNYYKALAGLANKNYLYIDLKHGFGKQNIYLFFQLLPYRQAKIKDDLYSWHFNGKTFYANYKQFEGLFTEYLSNAFSEFYALNCLNMTVIDVGGFVGDTALYFLENGAKKVIIYEPIPKNIEALKLNLRNHQHSIEIHQKALSDQDDICQLTSKEPFGSSSFGMEEGLFSIECEAITFQTLLKKHQADIIKIDCEGNEKYLIHASINEIQKIPYWIVEVHQPDIHLPILKKFEEAGFSKLKELFLTPQVTLYHFSKN